MPNDFCMCGQNKVTSNDISCSGAQRKPFFTPLLPVVSEAPSAPR